MDSSWEGEIHSILIFRVFTGSTMKKDIHYLMDEFITRTSLYMRLQFVKLVEAKGYFREANRLKFEMFLRDVDQYYCRTLEENKN